MADPLNDTAINSLEFRQPHWRVIAQGNDTEAWFSDNKAVGTGGILMPEPTRLQTGQNYYRFACSSTSRASQLGGGWWIDYEAFNTLSRFAEDQGYRLRDAARYFLALPYEWSKVDRLVTALLVKPLRAYTGYGKSARIRGDGPGERHGQTWTPAQHKKVRQLYIPGLYVEGREKQIYEMAFHGNPRISVS